MQNQSQQCPWLKISPKDNFHLSLTCFHMEAKNDFAIVPDIYMSVVFITPPPI
jgi:hypothetical protein